MERKLVVFGLALLAAAAGQWLQGSGWEGLWAVRLVAGVVLLSAAALALLQGIEPPKEER